MNNHVYEVEQLDTGALRLTCPTCGRVVRMRLEPYKRTVEVYGDVNVGHVFGAEALRLLAAEVRQDDECR